MSDFAPQSEFGALLFQTAKACEGRPYTVLDRVLTLEVQAWLADQERLPEPKIEAVKPWGEDHA